MTKANSHIVTRTDWTATFLSMEIGKNYAYTSEHIAITTARTLATYLKKRTNGKISFTITTNDRENRSFTIVRNQ